MILQFVVVVFECLSMFFVVVIAMITFQRRLSGNFLQHR